MSDIFPPRMSIEGQLTAAADRIKELQAQVTEIPTICRKYGAEIKRLKKELEWHLKTE